MRDPGSKWAPIAEDGKQGVNVKTQFIVHSTGTMASASANRAYFDRAGVVLESTFIIGLTPADPTLQILDSAQTADANGAANKRAISVEVVGDGVGPFTEWQVSELIRIGRWAAATHPIELRVIPSESASGFGWHVMFGAPGPWTSVRGKVCPGAARVDQLKQRVFPAIFANNSLEDDMPLSDDDVRRVADAVWFGIAGASLVPNRRLGRGEWAGTILGSLEDRLARGEIKVATSTPAAAPAAGAPVDINALADLVVDRLSARLAN